MVIVGNADYVEREWDTLEMLPKILVLHGSPMSRADLRAVNVNLSDMCIILSAKMSTADDPSMADKEAVLATLNINAMTFNKVEGKKQYFIFPEKIHIFQHDTATMEYSLGGSSTRKAEIYGSRVRTVLTEVVNDSNIQYLNTDDDDEPGSQLYVTQVDTVNFYIVFRMISRLLPLGPVWLCQCWTPSCPRPSTITRR